MMRIMLPVAAMLLVFPAFPYAEERFETAVIYLERNIQDRDAEIKFDVIGSNEGLAAMQVAAPDGRIVVDFKSPGSKLGLRHINLESPEPKNDGRLQADFPVGIYKFTGTAVGGAKLSGEAVLSHKFPAPTSFVHPGADAQGVPVAGLQVRWSPVEDLAAFLVVIEQERTGREIRVNLSSTTTAMSVPDGFLLPGVTYKLAIGTVSKEGNRSFIETEFKTATNK